MPLIDNCASNATVKVLWLLVLLVFTAPEGTPVGIMTEQLEMVSRATNDAPPGSHTVLRFTSGQKTFLREELFVVLKQIHDATQSPEQPPPEPMLPPTEDLTAGAPSPSPQR
jgi:hypothetical protein